MVDTGPARNNGPNCTTHYPSITLGGWRAVRTSSVFYASCLAGKYTSEAGSYEELRRDGLAAGLWPLADWLASDLFTAALRRSPVEYACCRVSGTF